MSAMALLAGIAPVVLVPAAASAEGTVFRPAGGTVIEGRYIVSLRQFGAASAAADALVSTYGGTVDRVYGAALSGFALAASEQQAKRLAADPRVERVEADAIVRAETTRPDPQWNLDRVDQRSTVLDNTYTYPDVAGQGVTVYVMDTGVRTSHAEFEGRASVGFDAINDGWNGQDCSTVGHGTHVAGIVGGATYGVASKVNLVSVRVLSCDNFGTLSQILAGIDWVTANAQRPAVANMSLGGGLSEIENAAVRRSVQSGVSYVVAAGNNEGDACFTSPAATPEAITVGASDPDDQRANRWTDVAPGQTGSNYGRCLDLFAPGESVKSAHNATDQATVILKGTSMASPHVAGAVALLLSQNPTLTPTQLATAITTNATAGVLRETTESPLRGSPNRLLYTGPVTPLVCTVSNDNRLPIPDLSTVNSTIEPTACARKVAANATVRVRVEHPYRGDISLRLIAPTGAEVALKEANSGDGVANIDQTFPLSMSTVDANGTWTLVVRDNFGLDEGALVGWTLTL